MRKTGQILATSISPPPPPHTHTNTQTVFSSLSDMCPVILTTVHRSNTWITLQLYGLIKNLPFTTNVQCSTYIIKRILKSLREKKEMLVTNIFFSFLTMISILSDTNHIILVLICHLQMLSICSSRQFCCLVWNKGTSQSGGPFFSSNTSKRVSITFSDLILFYSHDCHISPYIYQYINLLTSFRSNVRPPPQQ